MNKTLYEGGGLMNSVEIKKGIDWVGAVDWDRRIFDELIPLPDGTSYNSYCIRGSEHTALIDTVNPDKVDILFARLESIGVKQIDYVICNHAEQDHSGGLPFVLDKFPMAKAVCTPKCQPMLTDFFHLAADRFMTVNDRQTISLGDKTLEFIYAPWVHWPETMLTYLKEDRILFPCDFFGSHLATSDLYVRDECQVYESAKRYYAEIMMPFRANIKTNLERLKEYKIDMICASHGPVYTEPRMIIDAYDSWVNDEPYNIVVLPYISMHGSTREMVNYLVNALAKRNVIVKQFNLNDADIGKLAMALVDAATVVIGTPTALVGPHPKVAYAAFLANVLRPKTKYASIIGSYSWGSRAVDDLVKMLPNLKVEVIPPVMCKGMPREADFQALESLAETIAKKHEGLKTPERVEHSHAAV
jgi:flavorubredoxin